MKTLSFDLTGENGKPMGEVSLSYERTSVSYVEQLPFEDTGTAITNDRVIVGSLEIKDPEGKLLGTLKFTKEGMRYEYKSAADGQIHILPMRRLTSESELLFIADDSNFQSHFIPMLAFCIAQHHRRPEELERHISATCQSAPKYQQAIALSSVKGQDERGAEWDR